MNLTAYELTCGYVQKYEVRTDSNEYNLQMYRDGCYHVTLTVWDIVPIHKGCIGIETDLDNPVKTWFSTDKLTEARQEYARLLLALKGIKRADEIMDNFKNKCNENNI